VAGKRTGTAVQRNRIKRRLRATISAASLPVGFDYVFLAGAEVAAIDFATLKGWVDKAAR